MTTVATVQAQIRRHGLTAVDKADIAHAQNGCALCGCTQPGRKGWVIDHDRGCCSGDQSCLECRRGVLCQWCNNALGYAKDNPTVLRRMADYLQLGTRIHPSHVWNRGRLTDQLTHQSTDQSTDISQASPTETTDGTNEELTTTPSTTSRSVPHARISSDRNSPPKKRRSAHADTTPMHAQRPATPTRTTEVST